MEVKALRKGCPLMAQHIWDAIKSISHQRKTPTLEFILKFVKRAYSTISADTLKDEIEALVDDGLLHYLKRAGNKGCKIGVEEETYRLPKDVEAFERGSTESHDWYCFECHKAGKVIKCSTCFRVYHLACLASRNVDLAGVREGLSPFTCPACQAINDDTFLVPASRLNILLSFTCMRLKYKIPAELTKWVSTTNALNSSLNTTPSSPKTPNTATTPKDLQKQARLANAIASGTPSSASVTSDEDKESSWRYGLLVHTHMDVGLMEENTKKGAYSNISQFQMDAATVLHDIIIFHGSESSMAEMGRVMYRDCLYELDEIRLCQECYFMSNEMKGKHWFCAPCNPPHELVFARQKGYPYWPAKVIRLENEKYDVRFFGGLHERALIDKSSIKPITVSLASLNIKRSAGFNRAMDELRRHQTLLQSSLSAAKSPPRAESGLEDESRSSSQCEPSPDKKVKIELPEEVSAPLNQELVVARKSVPLNQNAGARNVKSERLTSTPNMEMKNENSNTSDGGIPVPNACDNPISAIQYVMANKEASVDDMVSSSCQVPHARCIGSQTEVLFNGNDSEQLELLKVELQSFKDELGNKEKELEEKHRLAISETKKKQWCYNCETEAIYHCCWNTAYCSTDCQQAHWQREHKRVCRRKR